MGSKRFKRGWCSASSYGSATYFLEIGHHVSQSPFPSGRGRGAGDREESVQTEDQQGRG